MRKSYIPFLIVLISLSLMGLIAIQIYWISNSIALRDSQFRRSVKIALSGVNHALEMEEAKDRMRRHNIGRRFMSQIDSIEQWQNQRAEQLDFPVDRQTDTSFYFSQDGKNILRVTKERAESYFPDPMIIKHERETKENRPRLGEKANSTLTEREKKFFFELMAGLVTVDLETDFLNKYSKPTLDSLLNHYLSEVGGITTRYEFGVFNLMDEPELISEGAEDKIDPLLKSGYKVKLFPNDFTQPTRYLRLWFPNQDTYLLKTLWPLLVSSAVFMIAIILAFAYSIRTIFRQKKISEIKNDFINNMTHELKTPISTISLACEALSDPVMIQNQQRYGKFVGMIRDENKRLGILVENVLRSAVLDKREMEIQGDEVDLHEVIRTAIKNIELQILQKGGKIEMQLEASSAVIKGDKIHLTNVVYNLLDNAIKYSSDNPSILVSTTNDKSSVYVSVKDNGIGIRKDEQNRIFDKLYRVPTGDVHNIKGFGLGLSYVKAIVEKHHGIVSVESELGKGSTFTIQIPYDYDL